MNIPGSAQGILKKLLTKRQLSIELLSKKINVSRNTIYQAMRGHKVSGKTHVKLIGFYCQTRLTQRF